MTVAVPLLTAEELDQFPDDGKRREVISGVLYVAPAPARRHQDFSMVLSVYLFHQLADSGAGRVFASPIDVRLSNLDQVRPDLVAIRSDRLGMYRGSTVHGAPDIIVEILSPSNPQYDEVEKRQLYASAGVSEYWIADPMRRRLTILRLTAEGYQAVEPVDGKLHSTAIIDFTIDPAELFSRMTPE